MIEEDDPRFLSPRLVGRVRRIITVLVLAEDMDDFMANAQAGWRLHTLSGNRQGEWSVSVSGNWRITFQELDGYVYRLNLEDYH